MHNSVNGCLTEGRSSRAGLGGAQGWEEHTIQEGGTKGRGKDSKDKYLLFHYTQGQPALDPEEEKNIAFSSF